MGFYLISSFRRGCLKKLLNNEVWGIILETVHNSECAQFIHLILILRPTYHINITLHRADHVCDSTSHLGAKLLLLALRYY